MFTKKELTRISNYIKSLPAIPDKQFTPEVIIKWDKQKTMKADFGGKEVYKTGIFYYPRSGKIEELVTLPLNYQKRVNFLLDSPASSYSELWTTNNKTYVTTPKTKIFSYYGKYHEKIGALEIASIEMEAKRGKEGEVREWYYTNIIGDRYFLFRNGESFRGWAYLPKDGKFYNKDLLHFLHTDIHQKIHNRSFNEQALVFTGSKARDEWRRCDTYWNPWKLGEWYRTVAERPVKEESVKNILLKSEDLIDYSEEYLQSNLKLQTANEGALCVPYKGGVLVRHYKVTNNPIDKTQEDYRLFFSNEEEFILKNVMGFWSPCSINNCYLVSRPKNVINLNALEEIPRVKRCLEAAHNPHIGEEYFFTNLIQSLKYPIIEKLSKAGYYRIAARIMSSPTTMLRDYFDVTPKKKGSIYQNLNLNKIQLKFLEQWMADNEISRNYFGPDFPKMKVLKEFGGEDVIHWDEKKTRKYFSFVLGMSNTFESMLFYFNDLGAPVYVTWNDIRNGYKLTEEDKKNLRKLVNLQAKSPEHCIPNIVKDIIRLIERVGEVLPNMNPYEARNFRDLEWMHDSYSELANQKKWEKAVNWEKWDEQNQKRIKHYEKIGDDFEIVVPRKPDDIVTEGASLNHCVGGYAESVISGYTTILFLRKTAEPDVSFYTIEVRNGQVIQIHGNHNQWLGNHPEAIQFVIDWLKDAEVECDYKNLFNLGYGYGSSAENYPMDGFNLNEYVRL